LIHENRPSIGAEEARDIAKAGDVLVYEGNGRADISSAGHLATVFFKKKGWQRRSSTVG